MRRSSEPEERAQFTVAELLARYGEPAQATGRRRRRAADDTGAAAQSAPQPIAQPNRADFGEPTVQSSGPLFTPDPPVRRAPPTQPGPARRTWAPAVGSSTVVAGRTVATGPVVAPRGPLTRTGLSAGPITDQIPRFDPLPMNPVPWSSRRPAGIQPRNAQTTSAPPGNAQAPAGLSIATRDIPAQDENVTADRDTPRTHNTKRADDTKRAQSGSPLWDWAVMVSQIGIGVVGGAALWLVCEWLWLRIPVVALVMALAVITGLVWIVRRVRRAEDLQTTVIAVLVGLFVTVSPAALLLVGR